MALEFRQRGNGTHENPPDFTKVQVGRLAPCASEALAAAAAVAESGEIELAAAGLVDGCHWFVLLVGDNKSVHC